jgi:hypothetical protein
MQIGGIEYNLQTNCIDCNENCKSKRDCYTKQIRQGVNKEREGTKWKPVTDRTIAIKINTHPILKHNDSELHQLVKKCNQSGFTKMFFWATKQV